MKNGIERERVMRIYYSYTLQPIRFILVSFFVPFLVVEFRIGKGVSGSFNFDI